MKAFKPFLKALINTAIPINKKESPINWRLIFVTRELAKENLILQNRNEMLKRTDLNLSLGI